MIKPSKYNLLVEETPDFVSLFNTRTGILIKVSPEAYHHLCAVDDVADSDDDPYIRAFARRGFCVPAQMDEQAGYRHANNGCQTAGDGQEISFTIAITTNCNYRCSYCFEDGVPALPMNSDTRQRLVSYILQRARENPSCQAISIMWFGGEPLLALSDIQSISEALLSYCNMHGLIYRSRMISNGSLLTKEIAKMLSHYNLVSFHLTMDGSCDGYCKSKQTTPFYYKKVMQAIEDCCEQIHINIRLNCHRENLLSILELVTELHQNEKIREHVHLYLAPVQSDKPGVDVYSPYEFAKVHNVFLQHLFELQWYEQIRNAVPKPKMTPCHNLLAHSFTVDPQGDFFDCESALGISTYRIGNLDTEITELQSVKQKLADEYDASLQEQCRRCCFFPICFSGCPAERIYADDCSCQGLKKRTLDTLRYISRIPQ